jgi:cysteinyl-tRNA synthetase
MFAMLELIKQTNNYLTAVKANAQYFVLQSVSSYVHRIMSMFGVIQHDETAFDDASSGGASREAVLAPVLDAFSSFRDAVRKAAQEKKDPREILQLCDAVRDQTLPDIGVRLEDVTGGPARWKLEDPAVLARERAEKQRRQNEERAKKLSNSIKLRRDEMKRWEEGVRTPRQRFEADGFRQFNEAGLPTHDKEGKELSKSGAKTAQKDFERYKKAHDAHLERLAGSAQYMQEALAKIEEDERLLAQLSVE